MDFCSNHDKSLRKFIQFDLYFSKGYVCLLFHIYFSRLISVRLKIKTLTQIVSCNSKVIFSIMAKSNCISAYQGRHWEGEQVPADDWRYCEGGPGGVWNHHGIRKIRSNRHRFSQLGRTPGLLSAISTHHKSWHFLRPIYTGQYIVMKSCRHWFIYVPPNSNCPFEGCLYQYPEPPASRSWSVSIHI